MEGALIVFCKIELAYGLPILDAFLKIAAEF
jgi:hypothetical protein